MNTPIDRLFVGARPRGRAQVLPGLLVALALSAGPAGRAGEATVEEADAAPKSVEAIVESLTLQIPQSVFVTKQDAGIRDPFFPESGRNWDPTGLVPVPVDLPAETKIKQFVFLRGITGQEGDKVALLNNQTFKVGDTVNLKLRDGSLLKVTMEKILATSVEFAVEGESKTFTKRLEQ